MHSTTATLLWVLLVICCVSTICALRAGTITRKREELIASLTARVYRLPRGRDYWWIDTPHGPMAMRLVKTSYDEIMEILFYFPEGIGFQQSIADRLAELSGDNYWLVPLTDHEADAKLSWETLTIGMTRRGPKTLHDASRDLLTLLPQAFDSYVDSFSDR